MKKLILLALIFCSACLLTSCGYNTKEWPRVSIPYEAKDITQININYFKDDIQKDFIVKDQAIISFIYSNVSYPYKEKNENNSKVENYVVKLVIEFIKGQNDEKYYIIFYNLGISKGYVDLNGKGLHFLPGDVESLFEKIEIKINDEGNE